MSFSTNTQSLIHRETRCRVLLSITNITKNVCSMIHKPSIIMHLTYIYIYIHTYVYVLIGGSGARQQQEGTHIPGDALLKDPAQPLLTFSSFPCSWCCRC